jgi:hypothetical protein
LQLHGSLFYKTLNAFSYRSGLLIGNQENNVVMTSWKYPRDWSCCLHPSFDDPDREALRIAQ